MWCFATINFKIAVFIPCHLNSIRFPKILTKICNIELIEHVRRRANLFKIKDVYIVTNSKTICNLIESYSGKVLITKKLHLDGSSRVEEAIRKLNYAKFIITRRRAFNFPSYLDKLNT